MIKAMNMDHVTAAIQQIDSYLTDILQLLDNPFATNTSQLLTDKECQFIEKISSHTLLVKQSIEDIPGNMPEKNNVEELNKYFSDLRHDLRNHVNSMMGYAEMILEDCQEQPTNLDPQKFITIVSHSSQMLGFFSQLQISPTKEKTSSFVHQNLSKPSEMHAVEPENDEEDESTEFVAFKKSFSILLVDDEDENCQLLKQLLLRSGYENIEIVHNAFDAKAELSNKQFDLVLLDINMPEVSGIELLESLKSDIAKFKLMVVMVTGDDTLENAIKCIRCGAEDFITKPIDSSVLKVRVNACARKKWFIFKESEYARHLEIERTRFENLLRSIFPRVIVKELSETGHVLARTYENVAVLFVDVVNFTHFCDTNPVEDTMKGIQEFSEICESAAIEYNLQKIKTIGDGFLASAGMLTKHDNPVLDCVSCAIDILNNTKNTSSGWLVRAGIDYGTIIGGVVGHRQYLFDVWGDTVNTASRVQAVASPDKICLTDRAWETIKTRCIGRSLDFIQLKGKIKPIEIFEFVQKI